MNVTPPTDPEQQPLTAPVPLLVAAVVVALEGLGTAVYGLAEAFHTTSARVVMGTTTSLFFVVYGAGMVVCAHGLRRVQGWARGPVLIVQLISLGLAWNFRDRSTLPIALLLAIPAVVVLVAMLHPATLAALDPMGDDTDDTD
ncbi:MAG: hypothetical protein JWP74_3775 [Marmoricola sp.]|nr:hypothetical protein [Marmoricola sp.]